MNTNKFTKTEKTVGSVIVVFWVVGALLSLGVSAAIIWGIINLIGWVTSK